MHAPEHRGLLWELPQVGASQPHCRSKTYDIEVELLSETDTTRVITESHLCVCESVSQA